MITMVYLSNYVVVIDDDYSFSTTHPFGRQCECVEIDDGHHLRTRAECHRRVGGKFIFKELILPKMAEQIERPIPTEER